MAFHEFHWESGYEKYGNVFCWATSPVTARTWLHDILQDVIGVIMNEQSLAGADAVGNIEIGGQTLHLSNPVSLPVLRKHKRGFLKLATQNNWLKVRTTENAKQLFVDYLGEHL